MTSKYFNYSFRESADFTSLNLKFNKMINHSSSEKLVRLKKLFFLLLLSGFTLPVMAQNITVSGNVTDGTGPLPGVTVLLLNSSNGTTTDFDGNYSLSNIPSNGTLQFSYVGFLTQEIQVNGRTSIDLVMEEDTQQLDEVVVVGYGSMERSNVTGSIVTVDVQEVQKTPIPNAIESLRGRVPGLQVIKTSGQPGAGVTFRVRGLNSLGFGGGEDVNNQPLIVIDGVPLIGGGGNLSELDTDDIESINVLKDAASTAIYGSAGANGVVLITTKSGKAGVSTLEVNMSTGIVDLANRINFMNGDQYVKYLFDSQVAAGNTKPQVQSLIDNNELQNYLAGKTVNWQDLLIKQGLQRNASLTSSGGSDKFSYYFNADAYLEEGIVTASDYERYSFRLNTDYKPTDWLKIGARVQMTKSYADETSNVVSEFNLNGGFAPFIPISNNTPLGDVYDDQGNLVEFVRDDQFQINPLYRYNESQIDREISRSYINPYLEFNLADGLTYTLNTFYEERTDFYGRFQSSNYNDGAPSQAQIQQSKTQNYLVDNIVNYNRDFGRHHLDATVVYGMQKQEYQQSNMFSENIPTDLLNYNSIGDVFDNDSQIGWETDEFGKSYLIGRLGYGFDGKYNVTLTMRRDGSSKFGENNKYGYFPSAAAAWNIHNEDFWGGNNPVSLLKLRLSYGESGNDNFPTYFYTAATQNVRIYVGVDENGDDIFFNGYGVGANAANPNLKWEESKQTNIGLDFGLFNNRLSGSVDVYQTKTDDVLVSERVLAVNGGFSFYPSNAAATENKGIEVTLKGDVIRTDDFSWNLSLNWAKDQNKIVRLSAGNVDADGNALDNEANGWFIGQDINVFYDYTYQGVWQFGEEADAAVYGAVPGDPKIADIDGDMDIDSDDRSFIGDPTPDWYGGINSVMNYKGFELSVLVEAVQGVLKSNSYYGGYNGRNNEIDINYWTPTNPSNEFPRVGSGNALAGGLFSNSIKIQDASFVALRNVSLGYNFPKSFLERTPFSGFSLYLRGNNLKYWTDYKDAFSPESDVGSYPITKTWVFGTKISF